MAQLLSFGQDVIIRASKDSKGATDISIKCQ
jgi:hypothetical protein